MKRNGSRKQDLIKMLAIRFSSRGIPMDEIKTQMIYWKKLTTEQLEKERKDSLPG